MHWFNIYSDTFANKALNITWNNPNLIRTTVALPRGQHYQLFRPELRGWIWNLIPCVSIWPIPSSAPRTELAQITWPRDRAHKRTGSRQNKSMHLWISRTSPSEWTCSRNSFIMLLMFCFTLSCFFSAYWRGMGGGVGGGSSGVWDLCIIARARWVNLSYSRQYASQWNKILSAEKSNFELKRYSGMNSSLDSTVKDRLHDGNNKQAWIEHMLLKMYNWYLYRRIYCFFNI